MDFKDLEHAAIKAFREKGLFLELFAHAAVRVEEKGSAIQVYYISDTKRPETSFYVDTFLFPEKEILVIEHITSHPYKGKGLGRLMVEATELFAQNINMYSSFIPNNGNQTFWKHMGYVSCEENQISRIKFYESAKRELRSPVYKDLLHA